MVKAWAYGLLAAVATVGLSRADFTGNDLAALCESADYNASTSCGMWVSGFIAGAYANRGPAGSPRAVCIPNGVTGRQARAIFQKLVRDRPDIRHLAANDLMVVALADAFPCDRSN